VLSHEEVRRLFAAAAREATEGPPDLEVAWSRAKVSYVPPVAEELPMLIAGSKAEYAGRQQRALECATELLHLLREVGGEGQDDAEISES
jgi:hypothetical protein